ncbi:MAG: S41 family peptidase [Gemmatimonadaceae bacterium]
MRPRAMVAVVALSSALVSGGLLVQRGLIGNGPVGGVRVPSGAKLFDQVYQHVSQLYVDTLSDSVLYSHAASGLVGELHDPHSAYLSPELLARLSERTSGKYVGVGIQIDLRDGGVTVASPLAGGPAIEAGIQAGDRIAEVDGKLFQPATAEEAQKALRGTPGSVLRVTIARPGIATPLKFALTRREIRIAAVQRGMMLSNGVGYVALTIFSAQSAPALQHAIDSLRTAGMTSLILDLRGDPGGLLDQGVGVAELFLDPGQKIVSMRGRTADASRSYSDQTAQPWPKLPMAVLVDSNTASAAEIVAGALQDHDRALLVGGATYGKGSAQNVFPLSNGGALKLTTALWYTPSGRSINKPRVTADARVAPLADTTAKAKARPRYTTDAGRTVLGGGGITPDVFAAPAALSAGDSALQHALGRQIPEFRNAVADYAVSLKASHGVTSPNFAVTPAMRAELLRRMRQRGILVDDRSYDAASGVVDRTLGYDVARYVFGPAVQAARQLRDDPVVTRAASLVAGASSPAALLERAAKAGADSGKPSTAATAVKR